MHYPLSPAFIARIFLFVLALASRFRLLLASDARLLIAFSFPQFGRNTGLYVLTLEPTQSAVQRFIFFYSDFCHPNIPPFACAKSLKSPDIPLYYIVFLLVCQVLFSCASQEIFHFMGNRIFPLA